MPALRRTAVSLFALALLVSNAVVVLAPVSLHTSHEGTTASRFVRALDQLFLTGHMFQTALPENLDVVIEGRRNGRWETLDPHELFVFDDVPGDRVARLYAARAQFFDGEAGQRAAWEALARRIADRDAALHPDAPIDAVRFGVESWPKDPAGYEARRVPGEVRRSLWFGWVRR